MADLAWQQVGDAMFVADHGGLRHLVVASGAGAVFTVGGGETGRADDVEQAKRRVAQHLGVGVAEGGASPASVPAQIEAPRPRRTEPEGAAQRQAWTAEQYHADGRVSRSDLELFRRSPSLYHGRKIARTLPEEETAALRLGRMLHLAVLEPEVWARTAVDKPKFSGRGARKHEADFKAGLAPGQVIVKADERLAVDGMARALRTSPTPAARAARALLWGPGETEVSITWRDDDPELARPAECRARLDRLLVRPSGTLVVDLKGSLHPGDEGFARALHDHGYHRQAAWYCHAAQALVGTSLPRFAFVVVRNEPPHEVAVYELEPEAIAIGAHEIRESLRALSKALVDNDWTASWERAVTKINLPVWARRKGEQALAVKETQ